MNNKMFFEMIKKNWLETVNIDTENYRRSAAIHHHLSLLHNKFGNNTT
ncbi:hypothetical protein [uncultured Mucilaginibacter sp.]|nr:hypothetical protein [uncultured Mucilaginibacter sp.]